METKMKSKQGKFGLWTALGLCTFLGGQMIMPESSSGAEPFSQMPQLDYRLEGKIVSIQGDKYVVRKPTGEKVRVTVNNGTNMFCEGPSEGAQKAGETQIDFKGKTSSGFQIGNCPPSTGQWIMAETTDKGTVTYLRTMDPSKRSRQLASERGFSQSSQRGVSRSSNISYGTSQTERLGLPQRYAINGNDGYAYFPVVREGLGQKTVEGYEVQTADGDKIGNLRKIIIDTKTGNIVYGIVELDQEAINQTKGMEVAGGSLMPLPWSAFQTGGQEGKVKLDVTTKQLANIPGFVEDMSIGDVRGYWELADPLPEITQEEMRQFRGDRGPRQFDKAQLRKAQERYQMALENFRNLDVVYRDDIRDLERAREQYEQAFLDYSREGGKKTIQQKLQSQIFR
jgi:sporulation protein YlmC with PRC-barrel domain